MSRKKEFIVKRLPSETAALAALYARIDEWKKDKKGVFFWHTPPEVDEKPNGWWAYARIGVG